MKNKLTKSITTGVLIQTHWNDGTLTEAGKQQEYSKWLQAQGKRFKYPRSIKYMGTANIDTENG